MDLYKMVEDLATLLAHADNINDLSGSTRITHDDYVVLINLVSYFIKDSKFIFKKIIDRKVDIELAEMECKRNNEEK